MVSITAPNRHMVSDTESPTQKSFVDIAGSYHIKNIANPWWCVHHHFGQRHPAKGAEHHLCPSAGRAQGCHRAAYSAQSLSYRCTAEQSKWQRFRTRISDGSRPRTWWIIVFTWHLSPCCALCRTVTQCHQIPPPHSLHITGPAQRPRVDKPHPTSVAGTRPAVAGCARKEVAQVVRNGSGVSNRYDCKFSHDTLNGDDVENRFPVIELVYNSRANRFKPTWTNN